MDEELKEAHREFMRQVGSVGGTITKIKMTAKDPDYYRNIGRTGGKKSKRRPVKK